MAVFFLKVIFFALTTFLNLVSRLIFSTTAYLIVLLIRSFKMPGQAGQGALEQVAQFIKACLEYVLELIMEATSSLIYNFFDLLKEGAMNSAAAAGSGLEGLLEKTRTSLDGLLEDAPQLFEGVSEMLWTIVGDLWDNYKNAVGYVTENA